MGHVITGDLNIIKNDELRQLIKRGPLYRERNNIDWNLNIKLCKEAVIKYKEKWAAKEKVDKRILNEWHYIVNSYIDRKVQYLKINCRNRYKKQVLKSNKCMEYLNNFHKEYVLVPADKATNNVIIICKKYYLEVILKELDCNVIYSL